MGSLVDIRESQRRNIPTFSADKNSGRQTKDDAGSIGLAETQVRLRRRERRRVKRRKISCKCSES